MQVLMLRWIAVFPAEIRFILTAISGGSSAHSGPCILLYLVHYKDFLNCVYPSMMAYIKGKNNIL